MQAFRCRRPRASAIVPFQGAEARFVAFTAAFLANACGFFWHAARLRLMRSDAPSSSARSVRRATRSRRLTALIDAGMDVARFNFSHGTHEEHGERLARLRKASRPRAKKPVAALQDLCGPKIRTGTFGQAPFDSRRQQTFVARRGQSARDDPNASPIRTKASPRTCSSATASCSTTGASSSRSRRSTRQGHRESSRAGRRRCETTSASTCRRERCASARSPRRTRPISSSASRTASTTSRSRSCAAPSDIRLVREICQAWGKPTPIIAKIETPDAVENLESVVAASDGVMVARGDLGVEFPPERVPVIQRQILLVARRVRRPVIVATEMLQSMTKSTRPTRAEASDVANAVFAGTDCRHALRRDRQRRSPDARRGDDERASRRGRDAARSSSIAPYATRATSIAEAIARGAVNTAREIGATFLVAFTESGLERDEREPRAAAACRSIAFSPNAKTRRRMALFWGVIPRELPSLHDTDALVDWVHGRSRWRTASRRPASASSSSSAPRIGVSGSTNSIRVHVIG